MVLGDLLINVNAITQSFTKNLKETQRPLCATLCFFVQLCVDL